MARVPVREDAAGAGGGAVVIGVVPPAGVSPGVRRAAAGQDRRGLAPGCRGHHAHAALVHHRSPVQAGLSTARASSSPVLGSFGLWLLPNAYP